MLTKSLARKKPELGDEDKILNRCALLSHCSRMKEGRETSEPTPSLAAARQLVARDELIVDSLGSASWKSRLKDVVKRVLLMPAH